MTPATTARWIIESGAQTDHLHRAWATGQLAQIPIGDRWDVIRITAHLGYAALRRIRQRGILLGPVLETPARGAVEVLVAPGTAAAWPDLRNTRAVGSGMFLCPAPWVTTTARGPAARGYRAWIIPPGPREPVDADALCEAVAAELCQGQLPPIFGRGTAEGDQR
ncbi:hypothetical protein GTW37_34785 [Streptomyces sp. SID4931]|nr:hypothetical protein [Streptomyces sp. SID4931]SCG08279.1 hypothetical protein GA0115255_123728 [Streptomyces sp. Ncost-T6T-2b]